MKRLDWVIALVMVALVPAFGQEPPPSNAPAPQSQSPSAPSSSVPASNPQAPSPAAPGFPPPAQPSPQDNPPAAPGQPAAAPPGAPARIVVPVPTLPRATLLLAYWPPDPDAPTPAFVDTIAIVDGSKLINPWERTSDVPGEVNRWLPHFDRTFFRKGRVFPIYSGGQRVDSAAVVGPQPIRCDSLSAAVRLSAKSGPKRRALAGGRPAESHADWQHPMSEDERHAFLALAQDALAPRGIAANQVELRDALATRLREHGPTVLVGDARGGSTRVFLVAEARRGGGYAPVIASVHAAGQEDGDHSEKFLDQLDVTGDGVDEIVTIEFYYDSWTYNIYRRGPKGVWENVYDGGGGGC